MTKASYNSRKKKKDEMVAARQFEISECKAITAEKERIMEVQAKVEMASV